RIFPELTVSYLLLSLFSVLPVELGPVGLCIIFFALALGLFTWSMGRLVTEDHRFAVRAVVLSLAFLLVCLDQTYIESFRLGFHSFGGAMLILVLVHYARTSLLPEGPRPFVKQSIIDIVVIGVCALLIMSNRGLLISTVAPMMAAIGLCGLAVILGRPNTLFPSVLRALKGIVILALSAGIGQWLWGKLDAMQFIHMSVFRGNDTQLQFQNIPSGLWTFFHPFGQAPFVPHYSVSNGVFLSIGSYLMVLGWMIAAWQLTIGANHPRPRAERFAAITLFVALPFSLLVFPLFDYIVYGRLYVMAPVLAIAAVVIGLAAGRVLAPRLGRWGVVPLSAAPVVAALVLVGQFALTSPQHEDRYRFGTESIYSHLDAERPDLKDRLGISFYWPVLPLREIFGYRIFATNEDLAPRYWVNNPWAIWTSTGELNYDERLGYVLFYRNKTLSADEARDAARYAGDATWVPRPNDVIDFFGDPDQQEIVTTGNDRFEFMIWSYDEGADMTKWRRQWMVSMCDRDYIRECVIEDWQGTLDRFLPSNSN
ncbi:MAG: hypothetical protein AAGP08_13025, partial [Pseudomonadota bacterium]